MRPFKSSVRLRASPEFFMKNIYIILTQTSSLPSRMIRFFTGDTYTHASIAFDDNIRSMYSFARRHAAFPLPAGLVEEHIDRGFYRSQGNIPCAVLSLSVSDRKYFMLRTKIYNMFCRADEYRYSIIGLLMCKFRIPLEIPGYFFCSQFVAKLLAECDIVSLPKAPALMHPSDFLEISSMRCLFEGGLHELNELRNSLPTVLHIPA